MDLASYHSILSGTSAWVAPQRTLLQLTGEDRVRFLNGQVTNNIHSLCAGQSCYAAVTTAKGKMTGDVWVHATENELLIDADPLLRDSLFERLEKFLISDDAEIQRADETYKLIHFFGPQPSSPCAPSQRYGVAGWDCWQPKDAPLPAGTPIDETTLEVIRVEHGLAKWGADMNEETLPPEAGLEKNAIRYDKGCYIGQEVISRLKSVGHVNRVLRVLAPTLENPVELAAGTPLMRDGKEIGRLTSVCQSPKRGSWIALGYIPYRNNAIGESFLAGDIALTIIDPPLS